MLRPSSSIKIDNFEWSISSFVVIMALVDVHQALNETYLREKQCGIVRINQGGLYM